MEKEEFLRLLPRLIREDDEVKGAIITALSGVMATKLDIEKVIEHSDKRFESLQKDMDKRFESLQKDMDKRFEGLLKQMSQGFEEARTERKYLYQKVEEVNIAIGSLGRRSGLNLEDSIRNLLSEKLIQENIETSKIHKEYLTDEEGIVFTKNYSTDIDVIIENGKVLLMEIKYSPNNQDIFHFLKVAELYELKHKPYDELILLGLEMKEHHIEYAKQQGIKVIIGKIII